MTGWREELESLSDRWAVYSCASIMLETGSAHLGLALRPVNIGS